MDFSNEISTFIMIAIKAMSCLNLQDENAENKFYAKDISQGVIDFERFAYLVSIQCRFVNRIVTQCFVL